MMIWILNLTGTEKKITRDSSLPFWRRSPILCSNVSWRRSRKITFLKKGMSKRSSSWSKGFWTKSRAVVVFARNNGHQDRKKERKWNEITRALHVARPHIREKSLVAQEL